MKKVAVIGLGNFGLAVISGLVERGAEVVAIDNDPDKIKKVDTIATVAIQMDASDKETLLAQGINTVEAAVVGMGNNFESSLLTTVLLKQIGVPYVVARALTKIQGQILHHVGADKVVFAEEQVGKEVAQNLLYPHVVESFELSEKFSIMQVDAPKHSWGKDVFQMDLRKNYGVNLIAIKRKKDDKNLVNKIFSAEKEEIIIPGPEDMIQEDDVLVLSGKTKAIENFISDK
jgi:trk system potassium uptake protein TrkA